MNTSELIARLHKQDVKLWIEGDKLKVSAPAGALDADAKAVLATRKDEILLYLRQAERIRSLPPAIVPLKSDGDRPPLFAFPGHNGDVFCWIHLARHVSAQQPLLAVQPPGLDGSEPATSIEELGSYAVEQIRRYRKDGPYLIAGYCAGGTIAYEVARQLVAQGQEVALLALFGAPFPTALRRMQSAGRWIRSVGTRARRHFRVLTSGPVTDAFRYLTGRVRQGRKTHAAAAERRRETSPATHRLEVVTQAAIRRYSLPSYHGQIDLFLPSESFRTSGLRFGDWESLADSSREHVGPDDCTNDVMLQEPWVPAIAALLERRLDELAAHATERDGT